MDPKLNFVLSRCTGVVDDQSLLIHLMSFGIESRAFPIIRELVDLRYLKSDDRLTVRGLMKIADTHRELIPKKDFLSAVLVNTPSTKKMIEVYSLLVSTETLRVKIFTGDVDRALIWLGYDDWEVENLKGFVTRHTGVND